MDKITRKTSLGQWFSPINLQLFEEKVKRSSKAITQSELVIAEKLHITYRIMNQVRSFDTIKTLISK